MFGDKPRELPQPVALILVAEFTMMAVTAVIEPLRLANRQARLDPSTPAPTMITRIRLAPSHETTTDAPGL